MEKPKGKKKKEKRGKEKKKKKKRKNRRTAHNSTVTPAPPLKTQGGEKKKTGEKKKRGKRRKERERSLICPVFFYSLAGRAGGEGGGMVGRGGGRSYPCTRVSIICPIKGRAKLRAGGLKGKKGGGGGGKRVEGFAVPLLAVQPAPVSAQPPNGGRKSSGEKKEREHL